MGTDRARVDAHLPLRPVEFHILLSLSTGERHGYGIIQDIEARGDAVVPDVGTMYRALARLVEQAFIEGVPAESADARRIDYRITTLGRNGSDYSASIVGAAIGHGRHDRRDVRGIETLACER